MLSTSYINIIFVYKIRRSYSRGCGYVEKRIYASVRSKFRVRSCGYLFLFLNWGLRLLNSVFVSFAGLLFVENSGKNVD